MIPTFSGQAIFGNAVNIEMAVNPNAATVAAFFGVTGVQSLDGGGRGRVFMITGLMPGFNDYAVVQNGLYMESFANGIPQTLIDTTGTPWFNVVFRREFQWVGQYMFDCTNNCRTRQYRAIFHGLT